MRVTFTYAQSGERKRTDRCMYMSAVDINVGACSRLPQLRGRGTGIALVLYVAMYFRSFSCIGHSLSGIRSLDSLSS